MESVYRRRVPSSPRWYCYKIKRFCALYEFELTFDLIGIITALVGVRVLNKTSDEYWFVLKLNVTIDKGNLDMKGLQPIVIDYFMMRLQVSPRYIDD